MSLPWNVVTAVGVDLERQGENLGQQWDSSRVILPRSGRERRSLQQGRGLAHDFNNLLTGITGSLELLQTRVQQGRTAELGRYVVAAVDAATRAAALTHRLLAFSRRQTLEPKATDIDQLAIGMEDLIRRTIGPSIELAHLIHAVEAGSFV